MSEILTEIPTLNLVEVNQRISEGLARVEEVKHKIEDFKEQSTAIKIIDENDKAGYAATKDFLSKVRPTRTGLENERKAVVKPFNDLISNVNDAYKNATSQLAAIEAPHKQEKEDYEAAEEKRKIEEVAAKEKVVNDKIAILLDAGLEYNAANGYYRNESGRAITRMDITNMPVEDFERFLEMVKDDYRKDQEKIHEEQLKKQKVTNRLNELNALSIPLINNIYSVTDASTDGEENEIKEHLTSEELEFMDDATFSSIKDSMVSLINKNKAYFKKIKDDAAAIKSKQLQDEQDLKDRENKLVEQQIKMKRQQVEIFQSKLPLFKFKHNDTLEESFFIYENYNKTKSVSIIVSDILFDDGAIDMGNAKVQELIKDGEIEVDKKINEDKAEEARLLKIRQDVEAKKKVLSRKEIGLTDPCVAEIFAQVAILKQQKLTLINEYTEKFIKSLEESIKRYNDDLRHLR